MHGAVFVLLAYVAAGLVTTWLGYWWFVAFVVISPTLATLRAVENNEYWPVVNPAYQFFYLYPAILILLQFISARPDEWGQWLSWSAVAALVFTGALTLGLRQHIDREWAVVGTLVFVWVFVLFGSKEVNAALPLQTSRLDSAIIERVSTAPRSGPLVTIVTESGERRTFRVGWDRLRRWQYRGEVCLCESSGALGWRWSRLSDC